VAKRRRCRTIFLGHHADDLVETFLINLFRGSGPLGLGAMREVSLRWVEGVDLTIVRPFLSVWRNEIDKYVRAHRLKFREDISNRDLVPLRNRLRRRIIPYLEKTIGRNIRQTIWRAAMIAGEEEAWIDQAAIGADGRNTELSSENVENVGFDLVERLRSLLDPAASIAKINLPRDRHVRRRAGKIFIE
jgi:tRNA(Ile)-lysidine synthase